MTHFEKSMVVSPQVIVEVIRDAHEFYTENKIDERYESMALDLVRRYVSQEGTPREVDPLFGAALYVVTRHPWSHPNPLTKTEFANRLRMKESSLEWYTDSIIEKLGFIVLYDSSRNPFYVDPRGTILSVVDSIVMGSVGEEVVQGIVKGSVVSPNALADKIVDRLCSVVKVVPPTFEHELHRLVQRKIEEESKRLLDQLDGRQKT
ncbi:MAG: hypothetical protein ACE5H4_00315 [Candidatus Thorarchaeota archaeon]